MTTEPEVGQVSAGGRIDRSSAIPLYHQLEYLLRQEIESGRYRPGDPLPSEGEICSRYEVSRSVVRQTLANLTHAGLVRTERGRGSFVAEPKLHERFVQRTTGLYDDLRRMGYHIRTHVVRQAVVELPLPVQEFLQTTHGVQIDRVRSVDGRVLAFIRSFVPTARCPGLEHAQLEDRSLYQVLADEYGLRVASGRRTVEAVAAMDEMAKHLGVSEGEPVLLLRSSSRDGRGEPLEWFEAWHRGDRTMFEIEIVTGEADQPMRSVVRATAGDQQPAGTPHVAVPAPDSPVAALAGGMAVLRAPRYQRLAAIVKSLVDHGLSTVEITVTGPEALAAIREARTVPGAVIGAGAVNSGEDARAAIAAGAQFLVAPLGAPQVQAAAGAIPVLLTGFTLTEVWAAWQATSLPVKVFPISVSGAGYLSALHHQLPGVPLVAAGGVDLDTAGDYLRAGAVAVAVGAALCPAEALVAGDVAAITQRAERLARALAGPDAPAAARR